MCNVSERHSHAVGAWHQHSAQRVDVLPRVARISNADRIAFASFYGVREVFAANGSFNDILDIADGCAPSRRRVAVDSDFYIRRSRYFSLYRSR